MQVKLAEALLRRKELQGKVDVLKTIQASNLFEVKGKRQKINEDVDDIILQVPLLTASQVTAEFDWHSRQLRLVDAAIQQVNWTTEVTIPDESMKDYVAAERPGPRGKIKE
jgi:hypothetical protein